MWSTRAMLVAPACTDENTPLGLLAFAVPRSEYEILDDCGGDLVLGMRASSSNSIRVERALVPEHLRVVYDFGEHVAGEAGTIGYRLHRNPVYLGRTIELLHY